MNLVIKLGVVAGLILLSGCSSVSRNLALNRPVVWQSSAYSEANQQLTRRSEALREAAPLVDRDTALRVNVVFATPNPLPEAKPGPLAGFTYEIGADYGRNGAGLKLDRNLYNQMLQSYASDRRAQIDKLCIAYFQSLDDMAGATRFAQNEINSVGDFAAVVMGITGSPAEHLAILAGAQALTNDSFDAVSAMMLLSPPPSVVFDLVKSRQRDIAAAAWVGGFATIGDAELFVSQYATTCVPVGIRAIVTATIANRATEANPDVMSAGQQASVLLVRQALNQDLPVADQLTSLTTDEAAFAVWYLGLPDCGTDLSASACADQKHIKDSVSAPLWKALTTAPANLEARGRLVGAINAVAANAAAIRTRKTELIGDYERSKVVAANQTLASHVETAEAQKNGLQTQVNNLRRDAETAAETTADLRAEIVRLRAQIPPLASEGPAAASVPTREPTTRPAPENQ